MAININIPIEDAVTDGSLNPVTSNAVFDALALKANSADLATVATTGDYNDLSNLPSIPSAQVNSDWNATSGVAEILNKPSIPSIAGLVPDTRNLTINGTTYDLSADRSWTIAGGGAIAVGTTAVTSGTVGRVLFEGTGNVVQQDSTLFWDNTNKRLGVGATPSTAVRLDVRAQGALSTDIAFRVRNSADTANIITANGRGDVFIGLNSGRITTGIYNTFVGIQSGFSNITGQGNTAIGANAGLLNLGNENTYLGYSAGQNGTTATGSVFIGYYAGGSSNASNGIFIGSTASTTGGDGTVAIGYSAGGGTGSHNLSLGQSSGVGMTSGSFNTHLGYRSVGSGVTTGNYNNLLGSNIVVGAVSNNAVLADNQGNQAIRKDANHNVLLGKETALATNATNGFSYFPTCAGTPTGVPAASFTGKAPIVIDSTNNKMYIYTNSAWVALN